MSDAVGPGDLVLCVNAAPNHGTGRPVPLAPGRPTASSRSWNSPAPAGGPTPCWTSASISRGARRASDSCPSPRPSPGRAAYRRPGRRKPCDEHPAAALPGASLARVAEGRVRWLARRPKADPVSLCDGGEWTLTPLSRSPGDGVEKRGDGAVHCVGLLFLHHVAGIIDDDDLRSGDVFVEALRGLDVDDPVFASP